MQQVGLAEKNKKSKYMLKTFYLPDFYVFDARITEISVKHVGKSITLKWKDFQQFSIWRKK